MSYTLEVCSWRYALSFVPTRGLQTRALNIIVHRAKGEPGRINAVSDVRVRLECANTTPCNEGMYLSKGEHSFGPSRSGALYCMSIESSIS